MYIVNAIKKISHFAFYNLSNLDFYLRLGGFLTCVTTLFLVRFFDLMVFFTMTHGVLLATAAFLPEGVRSWSSGSSSPLSSMPWVLIFNAWHLSMLSSCQQGCFIAVDGKIWMRKRTAFERPSRGRYLPDVVLLTSMLSHRMREKLPYNNTYTYRTLLMHIWIDWAVNRTKFAMEDSLKWSETSIPLYFSYI